MGSMLPSVSGSQILGIVQIIAIVLVVAVALGAVVILVVLRLKYNQVILLFKKVGHQTIKIGEDRASFERIGHGGDYWCRTRKFKKVIPRPRKQMGPNTYWFYEREDGEWVNFVLGDLDEEMKQGKATYLDEDMRLQRLGIQKNLAAEFQKIGFWQKFGGLIINALYILIVTVCLIVLFNKLGDLIPALGNVGGSITEMTRQIADNTARCQSGVVPVESPLFIGMLGELLRRRLMRWRQQSD